MAPLAQTIPRGNISVWLDSFRSIVLTEHVGALSFVCLEDGDDDDDDDDIVVGGATQDYKCPITLRLFVDPVTSYVFEHIPLHFVLNPNTPGNGLCRAKCPHSFSREAIYSMFRVLEIQCPQPGCRARFTKADLRPNKNLENRVKAFARREKERGRRERDIDMTLDEVDDD
jgi:SUMO ligase MMS21 Smc5/6 complex component